MITAQDIAILEAREPLTLAQWWETLNHWEWPEALPDPEAPPEGPPPLMPKMRRRTALLKCIVERLGEKELYRLRLRELREPKMTEEEFEAFWREHLADEAYRREHREELRDLLLKGLDEFPAEIDA